MVEPITQGNHAQLQHDGKIISLHDNRGKGSAYVWWVDSGGWLSEQIWKRGAKKAVFQFFEMGTACYAYKVVA